MRDNIFNNIVIVDYSDLLSNDISKECQKNVKRAMENFIKFKIRLQRTQKIKEIFDEEERIV